MDIHSDEGRIRRILVGVDGSEGAERAVHWQARLARQTGADVVAAHALSTPVFCRRVRIRDRNRLRRLVARLERVAIVHATSHEAGLVPPPGRGGDRVPSGDR
jgi:nucleotide-binding universal stress UspA family protein